LRLLAILWMKIAFVCCLLWMSFACYFKYCWLLKNFACF
jgi:hypothetical protein